MTGVSKTGSQIATVVAGLFYLAVIVFVITTVAMTLWGIIIAFKASFVIGLLATFVPPISCVSGYLDVFFDVNLPILIAEFINAHTATPIP